ncbi:MAG TPA: carbohydrate ABC transporter permease [Acidisoma sp.]|jgi:sorbitol/mannitol transport system permease protein|uniref:carbohydrate ABC transporter permease n=1 Tax=Acidisoma sp. TaxID=1872115 RepID=UPI002C3C4AFE|nr:carbohydrate ABC transporter permease [Acidisoma sp.]HTH99849.1 carbohydrate ABC transporter permease [Acidisoma sp.]
MTAAATRRAHRKLLFTALGWIVGLVMAFPILWMALTAFKSERQAVTTPPLLFFRPTLESFATVFATTDYGRFVANSIIIAGGSTLIALLLAFPAAYAMVFFPSRRTRGLLMWMLSTKMMPAVGVLVPIYLLFRDMHLLDTRTGMIGIYTLMNLPIVIWMLYSFFRDIPRDIVEAGFLDGATTLQQLLWLLLPLAAPGVAATILLNIVLCWNEAFWSINLTATHAAPLTAFIATFSSPEGLFWAKLSAASLLAVAPIMAMGLATQRHLVTGLTFGAVK